MTTAESQSNSEDLIRAVDAKIDSIRTQSLDFSFNELADMYADNELIINPEFQRMFRWPEGSQSRFIESLLLELPIPPIYLIEREDRVYELIDGLQRLSSYLHFRGQLSINGELLDPLTLSDCDIVPEINGLSFEQLPRALEIKLKRSYIRAEILRKESDARLRYYMFKRLNTGGEVLSEQEVRNATIRLLSNDFNTFIGELSKNEDFQYCISTISDNSRLKKFDEELVLRFFALKNDIGSYKHDVADFLTDYMEAVSDEQESRFAFDYDAERLIFEKTFKILRLAADKSDIGSLVFGSVVSGRQKPRGQFSVYHYEGLTLGLQQSLDVLDPDNNEQMDRVAEVVQTGKADPEFIKTTGSGKNDRVPMAARIKYFADAFAAAVS